MDKSGIENLAKLAKLHISDNQIDEVAASLSNVLALVDQLAAADTTNVTPLAHPLDAIQSLRADEVAEDDLREQFQNIAPATENGLYLVPKVID